MRWFDRPKPERRGRFQSHVLGEPVHEGPGAAKNFTGSCPIREHTADGHYVGRCCYPTYDGVCYRHRDVSQFLVEDPDLREADDRIHPRKERI